MAYAITQRPTPIKPLIRILLAALVVLTFAGAVKKCESGEGGDGGMAPGDHR